MSTPGFTAETSLYRTSASYHSLAIGSDRLISGIITDNRWTPHFGSDVISVEPPTFLYSCGALGKACCRAPHQDVPAFGPLVSCQQGLGCDITTNKCVSTCGGPGQVCCDGPETRATKWTAAGWNYSPSDPNLREMCDAGVCDRQTHRCITCGTRDGGRCCSSDAAQAIARCFRDAKTDHRLVCIARWVGDAGGMCVECGDGGQPACETVGESPCADGYVERNGLCVPCGWAGQPTCDLGEPCRGGHSVPNRSFSECLPAGGPNQPCRPDGGCDYQGLFCNNGRICQSCGHPGEICCPPGRLDPIVSNNTGCLQPAVCLNNRCFACGQENMPVCPGSNYCSDGSESVNGWCRPCGKEGQVCCRSLSIYCDPGMTCKDNVCRRPTPPPPPPGQLKTCNGEDWGFSTMDRTVFIKHAPNQCIDAVTYKANSAQEAYTCARRAYGDAVVTQTIDSYKFALTSGFGCHSVTVIGTDESEARTCAQWQCINCTVTPGDCP